MGNNLPHILYVDDSADDRQLYAHYLSTRGFRVTTADNGTTGLEKAFNQKPDLVLMDLWLPEIGGWQAAQCLKSDARTRHIPVMIITGHSPLGPEVVGCDGMLTKPFLPNLLLEEILRVLNQADAARENKN